jgi:outer membrane protein assembly factor BamD (BamD/ComL family)
VLLAVDTIKTAYRQVKTPSTGFSGASFDDVMSKASTPTEGEPQEIREEKQVISKEEQEQIATLEQKAFENAKQFNTISDYKASLVALENFITDFPGTPYKEDALYYKLDSAYLLAINSVPSKMEERLTNAKIAYDKLIKFNNDTKYKDKADKMLATIDKELQQFSNK